MIVKLFFITLKKITFPSTKVRRCPSVFITYSTALRLHNPLYGWALALADLWLMTHGHALTCERTLSLHKGARVGKKKIPSLPHSHLSNMKPLKESEVTCGGTRGGWPASLHRLHPSPPLAEQRMAPLPAAVPHSASRAAIRSLTANIFFFSQPCRRMGRPIIERLNNTTCLRKLWLHCGDCLVGEAAAQDVFGKG